MRIALALVLLFAPLALDAGAPPASLYSVNPAKSLLRYNVKHKLHEVSAEAHQLEGKVALRPDGSAQVMVRAKVADFRSGDGNRDEHMLETLHAANFPLVSFKGVARFALPAAYPATQQVQLDGELDFHGRKKRETFPVTVELQSPTDLHVTGRLSVSLDAYGVERPSLLLMPIDDACLIDLDLSFSQEH